MKKRYVIIWVNKNEGSDIRHTPIDIMVLDNEPAEKVWRNIILKFLDVEPSVRQTETPDQHAMVGPLPDQTDKRILVINVVTL